MTVQSVFSEELSVSKSYLRSKRVLDVVFIVLIAPFVLLVAVVIAICIKLDSRGTVFFRQKRVGQNGVEFEMLKFRSMYPDSDSRIHQEKIIKYMNGSKLSDDGDSNLAYKDTKDPRITRVGRFIRKTSLDELPQFWNVVCGDMTLVGPRPPLSYEVSRYTQYERQRLLVRPGLTGPWQVYGRSRVTFQEMIEMDITYIQTQSLWQDLKLIVQTIPVMVFARGGA